MTLRRATRSAAAGPARISSGSGRRRALTELTDAWVPALFDAAGGAGIGAALVAVGGYGRCELSPGSDLDLLLLVPGHGARPRRAPRWRRPVWYPVWDAGSAARPRAAHPRARRAASPTTTCGPCSGCSTCGTSPATRPSARALREAVLADWRGFARRRLPELFAACRRAGRARRRPGLLARARPQGVARRAARPGRAAGGRGVVGGRHAGTTGSTTHGSALLDVRDALHDRDRPGQRPARAAGAGGGRQAARPAGRRRAAAAGRRGRPPVAYALDDAGSGSSGRSRPRPAVRAQGRRADWATRAPLADGVVEQDGEVVLARDARPADDPALVLRAAAAAAQAGLRLAPHTVERLATECPPLPEPWPRAALDGLLSLLGAGPRRPIPVWEALDQAGLTARLLPDWERVRSRPQRNAVHRFTVDRHLVETAVRRRGVRAPGRPAGPAARRRAAARHRQGLAGRPLRGGRRGGGRPRRRGWASAAGRRRGAGDAGAPPPAAAGHGDPARPGRPGDGRARRRGRADDRRPWTCCTR